MRWSDEVRGACAAVVRAIMGWPSPSLLMMCPQPCQVPWLERVARRKLRCSCRERAAEFRDLAEFHKLARGERGSHNLTVQFLEDWALHIERHCGARR